MAPLIQLSTNSKDAPKIKEHSTKILNIDIDEDNINMELRNLPLIGNKRKKQSTLDKLEEGSGSQQEV